MAGLSKCSLYMKKIRILHLTTDSRIAGAENLLLDLAQTYNQDKFELYFCTIKKEGMLHQEIRKLGYKCYSLNCHKLWNIYAALFRLLRILRNEQISILHTHLYHAGIIGLLINPLWHSGSVVMTRHYSDFMHIYGNRVSRFIDYLVAKKTKHIIAISEAAKKTLEDLEKIDGKKITIVPNGINLTRWHPIKKERFDKIHYDLGLNGFNVIGAVGSLEPRKNHEVLLKAAAELSRDNYRFKILIVGDGILRDSLRKTAEDLNIDSSIIFTGYCRNIPDLLSVMDIFVQPSREEGFGISILEAMAMYKPVVTSSVGGISEIVIDGVTGILFDCNDYLQLADILRGAIAHKYDFKQMVQNARKRVERYFTIQRMARGYEEAYSHLTG